MGGITVGFYPAAADAALAFDVCRLWQALHGQGRHTLQNVALNFPEARYQDDEPLLSLLRGLPTLQDAAR